MLSAPHNGTTLYNNFAPPITAYGVVPQPEYQISDDVLHQVTKSRKRFRDSSSMAINLITVPISDTLSFLGEDLSFQLTQQQSEADHLISLHMERVRAEIEERTRIQSIRVIQSVQESVRKKVKQTEDQIEEIWRRNCELEERVRSLYLENQIWRDLARSNEATANALRLNLEQVLLESRVVSDEDDTESSCCGSSGGGGVDEEERSKRMCRRCAVAESSVLLLPCRHLCVCAACGPSVDACPVCNSVKNASVHVNLS